MFIKRASLLGESLAYSSTRTINPLVVEPMPYLLIGLGHVEADFPRIVYITLFRRITLTVSSYVVAVMSLGCSSSLQKDLYTSRYIGALLFTWLY